MKRVLEAVRIFFRNLGGKMFSSDEVVIRIKKSSLSSFILGFVFAAPIFIGGSWLVGSSQAAVGNSSAQNAAANVASDTAGENMVNIPVDIQITEKDHILGGKDAGVTLVVYSDLQCPYCAKHYETIKALAEEYGNKILVVFRHFPLSFHQYSNTAANAAECASEQGKFWEFIDVAFQSQADYSDTFWAKLAGDLKLNVSKFNKCLTDKKYDSVVNDNISSGEIYGVQGTPTTFVNGELVSGAVPQSEFETNIDKLLQ
jgi:protein-disulfide isomerase